MMSPLFTCPFCGSNNRLNAHYCRSCGQPLRASKYHHSTGRLLPNTLLKQRYRIIEPVGQGGFGAVYQAEDIQLGNRQVAIKEMSQAGLSPQEQKEAADAFRQEAIMLAHLQHPNLPGIIEHFEEDQRWYLVMSFIEGETLEDYLGKQPEGKIPLNEAIDIGVQICTVLNYLHDQQPPIIFRDLKPANIMRTPGGHIYLIDFGIARIFKPGKARDTAAYGSTGYAAPEQYGRTTSPRSDIYSLGATLHQLISGHDPSLSPFHFPPLQTLVPAVPPGLATFITQMLDMDESKRPGNMQDVKQVLQLSLADPIASPSLRAGPAMAQPGLGSLSTPRPKPSKPAEPAGTILIRYTEHSRPVHAIAWSPDGKWIASASQAGVILVWRTDQHQKTFIKMESAQSIAWSPDSKWIVSDSERAVEAWDADGGPFSSFSTTSSSSVLTVAWSPDGKRIAFGSQDGTVQVWPSDGLTPPFIYKGHAAFFLFSLFISSDAPERSILALAWSPDGTRLASSSQHGSFHIWNADDGDRSLKYKTFPAASFRSITWSPDGNYIACASQAGTVQGWVFDGSEQPFNYGYSGYDSYESSEDGSYGYSGYEYSSDPVLAVAWSPDGTRIACAYEAGYVKIWQVDGGGVLFTYNGHSMPKKKTRPGARKASISTRTSQAFVQSPLTPSPILAVAWSPDSKRVASASQDGSVHIWNSDGSGIPFIYRGHTATVRSLMWSPDGRRMVSASDDGTIQVWSANTVVYKNLSESIWSIAWSPDGKQIASASEGGTVQIWNTDGSGQPFILKNHAEKTCSVAWSPDGKRIASASKDGTIRVGSVDGRGRSFVYRGHTDAVYAIAWSPDGTEIASTSRDKTVHIWSVNSISPRFIYKGHTDAVLAVAWSPDSTRIVSSSRAREAGIHVWNADGSGQPFLYEDHDHYGWEIYITAVAWSPDGSRIASGTSGESSAPDAASRVVHVWNADGSGSSFIFKEHSSGVLSLAWSPDSAQIASSDEGGLVLVWSAG